jgi:3,4-dihydroxy 2-butanone 4-phosphate synthase/GTP cyclohydrolase II
MFSPIPDILADLRAGKMIVLTDDEQRENEGDLVMPAQFITPEAITFMLSVARGYLCLSLTAADCDRLDLPPQAPVNTSARGTPFTVSIDGHPRHSFTTGVSAKERARTIRMAIDPASRPDDFVRPGHINPLRSRDGGVLVRTGQTEGSLDLCRLAGLYPAAAIIEIMRDDGEMARVPDLERLCAQHGLKMCSVAHVIEHRLARESLVRRIEPVRGTPIRTEFGPFNLVAFESVVDALPHVALTAGGVGDLDARGEPVEQAEPTLVRVHRRHLLGDVFGDLDASREGPTGQTLRGSMRLIQQAGRGAIVYLRPEGPSEWAGEGPIEPRLQSIRRPGRVGADAPDLTHPGAEAANIPAQIREYGIGSQILRALGLRRLRLLTNHQTSLPGLEAFGLEIVERVAIPPADPTNRIFHCG